MVKTQFAHSLHALANGAYAWKHHTISPRYNLGLTGNLHLYLGRNVAQGAGHRMQIAPAVIDHGECLWGHMIACNRAAPILTIKGCLWWTASRPPCSGLLPGPCAVRGQRPCTRPRLGGASWRHAGCRCATLPERG